MFSCKKINDIKVKDLTPVITSSETNPYEDLFSTKWFNLYICSRKFSGKTNLIFNILKQIADKKTTTVFIFSSTVSKDQTWISIVEYLRSKKIKVFTNTSIKNDNPDDEEFDLESVVDLMKNANVVKAKNNHEEDESTINCQGIKLESETNTKSKKKQVKKPLEDFIVILDDLSSETRSKDISVLLKKNRHYRCRTIISSQYLNDMEPQALKNLDYWILLPGHSLDKLEDIHKHTDSNIEFEDFVKIYEDATSKKYNFLYIDVNGQKYRHNFDEEYFVTHSANATFRTI